MALGELLLGKALEEAAKEAVRLPDHRSFRRS
jgi:hypothetical protein